MGSALVAFIFVVACLGYITRKSFRARLDQRKFKLLDLLVVLTLIGSLIGLAKGMFGEEQNGMPVKSKGRGSVIYDVS